MTKSEDQNEQKICQNTAYKNPQGASQNLIKYRL